MVAKTNARVDWVDYSKGICIIAVVCLYTTQHVQDPNGALSWMLYWVDFARPFRMPDFFLIAGLFLSRTIDAPWRRYLDKKVVHFFYFFALWTTIYFVLHAAPYNAVALSHHRWSDYLTWYVEPFHMLWFIEMLPIYFVVTRLLKSVPWPVVLVAAAILQMLDLHLDAEYAQVNRFCARYVYFYAGYKFAPMFFRFAEWARTNESTSGTALLGWALVNETLVLAGVSQDPGIGLLLGFAGAGGVIVTGCLLSRANWTGWIRYLGQNSIVVFLSFFVFTLITNVMLKKLGIIDDLGTRQLIVTCVAVAGPVLAYRAVRNTPMSFLFSRPAWARLRLGATLDNLARTADVAARQLEAALGTVAADAAIPPVKTLPDSRLAS